MCSAQVQLVFGVVRTSCLAARGCGRADAMGPHWDLQLSAQWNLVLDGVLARERVLSLPQACLGWEWQDMRRNTY
jgi:hypothetical protein